MNDAAARRRHGKGEANQLQPEDRAVHEWYRFVLSFPPHLVRRYVQRFGLGSEHQVLDPFCGTGTTVVECKKLGVPAIGIEANPMASFASRVKTDWTPDADGLVAHALQVAGEASAALRRGGILEDPAPGRSIGAGTARGLRTLPPEQARLLLADSISPLPLHKTLVLRECLVRRPDPRYRAHERLALARVLVQSISNLRFGPEVGVGPPKTDSPVIPAWLGAVGAMADDLRQVGRVTASPAVVYHADSRNLATVMEPCSIDAVITSPPYPNEKDYTRATRLESVLLGFIRDRQALQAFKRGLVRSNTRGVYQRDDDDQWVQSHPEIQRIAAAIEARRVELGKTSGFERMYARVTRLYFGGMARHLAGLRQFLRPGAHLAYVVGDQASYLRVMIRTGQLLGDIASSLGYQVSNIDLFRTRLATATREQLREEVVVLRWRG
jgi:hypothetical protein